MNTKMNYNVDGQEWGIYFPKDIINEDVINELPEDKLNEILTILTKAGY